MSKQKITKEMVVDAAFQIVREEGMERMLVKNIASRLGCSVQPIYSYCSNMEGLRQDVMVRVDLFMRDYLAANIDRRDFFRSTGHAYVKLAREEPHVFQLFVTRRREGVSSLDDLYRLETNPRVAQFIADGMGVTLEQARRLHLNMLIYTVGVGTILATVRPGIPDEEITARLEDAKRAFSTEVIGGLDVE